MKQNVARAAEAPTTPRTIKDRVQAASVEIAAHNLAAARKPSDSANATNFLRI